MVYDNLFEINCSKKDGQAYQHSKLFAKSFAKLHSDWPKLIFGFQALVRSHRKLPCVLPDPPKIGQ